MVGFLRNVSVATLLLLVPGLALAQAPAPATAASPPPADAPSPGATNPTPAPAGANAAPAPPRVEATGYGYGGPAPRPGKVGAGARTTVHRARRSTGPVATFPGFEMLPDGSSRMFVQLTQQVPVEEKKAAGTITYVLKGAHIDKRNNKNALVTVHFNTPASRARLVPVGKDLHFVVELRANVAPRFKMDAAKDNTALLFIDFPKGDFLPNTLTAPNAPSAASPPPQTLPETTNGSPP